jgi:predicted transcriptional regulator
MGKSIRELMSDNPCSIDADKSVAYAAKMMRDEDVGLAPIVEGDRLADGSRHCDPRRGRRPRPRVDDRT